MMTESKTEVSSVSVIYNRIGQAEMINTGYNKVWNTFNLHLIYFDLFIYFLLNSDTRSYPEHHGLNILSLKSIYSIPTIANKW